VLDNVLGLPGEANGLHRTFLVLTQINVFQFSVFKEYFNPQNYLQKKRKKCTAKKTTLAVSSCTTCYINAISQNSQIKVNILVKLI
jgi:hypothetical protein